MTTKVLFVQGGGEGAHACDLKLARSLEKGLGAGYRVLYPKMPNESDPNYPAWKQRMGEELRKLGDGTIVVAHSIGASILLKMLAEDELDHALRGVFIVAAPFLHAREGWQWKEAELPANAAKKLPPSLPMFLYHGREDEVVPFSHFTLHARTFPQAVARALDGRNHQMNDDLSEVARDIRGLE